MKMHLKYLWYILRHKWFVFIECCKLGIPLLGIIHDWQKFTLVEWKPYAWSFYGPWKYQNRPQWLVDEFDRAWLHHQHLGPHHWQYWILTQGEDDDKVLPMPDRYRREMLADWCGAWKVSSDTKVNPREWYLNSKNIMKLHPETRKWIEDKLMIKGDK